MRPAKIFVVSDTHFGHKRVLEFSKKWRNYATIYDHDRDVVARWNAVVRPQDTVWHLGDVYFGGRHNHAFLGELAGNKKLVMGNHDHYPMEFYQKYFTTIMGAMVLGKVVLTHIPIHFQELRFRFTTNFHGHLHGDSVLNAHNEPDPRYICVSLEHTDLRPVPLYETLNHGLPYSRSKEHLELPAEQGLSDSGGPNEHVGDRSK